ncbi:hypothetical protein NI456_11245 [Brevundimonas diminuta]|uniref:hypothetical protein n=1 Tax=Brevundimonas diminuta TaxID=293 RepID=UPI002096F9FB|nr:hypothetical protein [Brevundimonas diminuta]MCO8019432.1 hypothetical protein [Brevundimonas diminuta]MCO8022110.1 hypothetical protein [Brevundimonas diminuta]
MGNPRGTCIVCGESPTVKSHLFPRAVMLDMRGDAKALYEGSRHEPGYREQQNGPWDDRFLCKRHEDQAGAGDEYAVDFCRRIDAGEYRPFRGAFLMSNPVPAKLLTFIYGTVWRHAVAPRNASLKLNLGPYERELRAALFEGRPMTLQAFVSLSTLSDRNGKPVSMGLAPYRQKFGGYWTWHFIIGRLDVQLKTDKRPFPADWSPYLANDADPVVLHAVEPADIATVPLLRPITDNIRATVRPPRSS